MTPDSTVTFFQIALSLFLVMNAIGQIPVFVGILAPYEAKRQRFIIIRELIFALIILLTFNFFGDPLLEYLGIDQSIIGMAGGILLFLVAIEMVFPKPKSSNPLPHQEPMIVPLAIPVITGPGSIAMVMTFAHDTDNPYMVALAALCAWVPTLIILLLAPYFKKFLGDKGLQAVERLGGMLVVLIGVQMVASGVVSFIKAYFP